MNNNIIPDISFELGGGDLSINDIMSQTQGVSSEQEVNDFFSNGSEQNNSGQYQEESEYDDDQDSGSSYNVNQIEDFKIESADDFKSQIESQVNGSTTESVEKQQEENNVTDAYSAALQILRDQQILNIPDDINELDESTLQELIEYDQELRNQQALDFIKSQASDPRLADLIDYVLEGGSYEDAIVMKDIIDEQYSFYDMDVAAEQDQRMLIEMYIREGLNPNNPIDQRRLNRLDDEIDGYINNLEGEDLASEAKSYFIDKLEYVKEVEKQKITEREMEMQNYQRQKLQQEKFWVDQFKKSLNEKPWSNDKKKEIVSQFDIVQLDNGSEMEMWKYKWNKIWEKPDLTQVFMDFIGDLDPYTLEFKNRTTPVQKQVTNKILEIVNNKKTVSNKFKSEGRPYQQQNGKDNGEPKKAINPSSDW